MHRTKRAHRQLPGPPPRTRIATRCSQSARSQLPRQLTCKAAAIEENRERTVQLPWHPRSLESAWARTEVPICRRECATEMVRLGRHVTSYPGEFQPLRDRIHAELQ